MRARHAVSVLVELALNLFLFLFLVPFSGPWKPEPRRWKDDPGTPFNSMLVSVMTYNVLSDALMR